MSNLKRIIPTNKFRNNDKAIGIGNVFWDMSEQNGLARIIADLDNDILSTTSGHKFINFSCCSYLDLDSHSKIIQGAIDAVRRYGVLDHCIARSRVQLPIISELEESLGELFNANVLSGVSASSISGGLLPIIASGHLGNGVRPLMIFDKQAHVSLAAAKPACADESEVVTCNYHDLNFIEDCCKQYERVCYVVDGSDSLGGYAPVKELAELQNKYGLIVFYDDSHSISAYGKRGIGYVRSHIPTLDENTIMVVTLNKAFGTSGAAILLNGYSQHMLRLVERFGGGLNYSQNLNTASIGASLASAEIHRTEELTHLQKKLYNNIALFDSLVSTEHSGSTYPIRLVPVSDDMVIKAGRQVIEAGFYVSPVFFPIVAKGTAGLRVMIRAGHTEEQIRSLCNVISNVRRPQ